MLFRHLLIAALIAPLSGCWFVFIPGSVISAVGDAITGAEGQHCVGESAKIGDKIKHPDGRIGTVQKVSGFSGRCQNTAMPIRAVVTFD